MPTPPDSQQLQRDASAGIPEAQFLLSQTCFRKNDLPGMVHWLEKASVAGLSVAHEALGYCHEIGRGMTRNFAEALSHYDLAIRHGASRAAFLKAQLLYKSQLCEHHETEIRTLLLQAAASNFAPALRTLGFLALQSESRQALAIDLLLKAAVSGDLPSTFMLGWCLRDSSPEHAAYWLDRAAISGFPHSSLVQQGLSGISPRFQPSQDSQTQFPDDIAIFPPAVHPQVESVMTDPPIRLFNNVLNTADCAYLIFMARPNMQRADVIDPSGNKSGMTSDVRTNMSTYLSFDQVDIISRYIEQKLVQSLGGKLEVSEPMSVLFYSPGEYYQPHYDYFSPTLEVTRKHLEDGGQRIASAVTCLHAPEAGGSTSFPQLNIRIPARAGNTLWFRNCDEHATPDPRTLHAGDRVTQGEKWVVTKWFRERNSGYQAFKGGV